MARVLSTLSPSEQSRFEAFRRSSVPADAVRDYLAHLLTLHDEQLSRRCLASKSLLVSDANTTSADLGTGMRHLEHVMLRRRRPHQQSSQHGLEHFRDQERCNRPLHDLVQPGEADSIVVVVCALAKAYAQRLVAAAKRVGDVSSSLQQQVNKEQNQKGEDDSMKPSHNRQQQKPLKVHHIQQAHDARVKAGLDPGFFMQRPLASSQLRRGMQAPSAAWSCPGRIAAAALKTVERHELLRQAALQAQEDYDQYVSSGFTEVPEAANLDDIVLETTPVLRTDDETKDKLLISPSHKLEIQQQKTQAPVKIEPSVELTKKDEEILLLPSQEKPETVETSENKPSKSVLTSSSTLLSSIEKEEAQLTNEKTTELVDSTKADPLPSKSVAGAGLKPIPVQPAAPKVNQQHHVSMEDALLMDLDDDSDDDDDDEE